MEKYIEDFNKINDTLKKQLKFKANISKKLLDSCKENLDKAKLALDKIEKEYEMISSNTRIEYKGRRDDIRQKYCSLQLNYTTLENQYNFENNILKDNGSNSNKEQDSKKEPLLVNHIIRYDKEGKRMKDQVGLMGQTNKNFQLGLEELKKQENQIDNIIDHTDGARKNLTLHQQLFGVLKNKSLMSRLKLIFIVVFLFLADLMALYIKFKR
jgi:hypothetical protein